MAGYLWLFLSGLPVRLWLAFFRGRRNRWRTRWLPLLTGLLILNTSAATDKESLFELISRVTVGTGASNTFITDLFITPDVETESRYYVLVPFAEDYFDAILNFNSGISVYLIKLHNGNFQINENPVDTVFFDKSCYILLGRMRLKSTSDKLPTIYASCPNSNCIDQYELHPNGTLEKRCSVADVTAVTWWGVFGTLDEQSNLLFIMDNPSGNANAYRYRVFSTEGNCPEYSGYDATLPIGEVCDSIYFDPVTQLLFISGVSRSASNNCGIFAYALTNNTFSFSPHLYVESNIAHGERDCFGSIQMSILPKKELIMLATLTGNSSTPFDIKLYSIDKNSQGSLKAMPQPECSIPATKSYASFGVAFNDNGSYLFTLTGAQSFVTPFSTSMGMLTAYRIQNNKTKVIVDSQPMGMNLTITSTLLYFNDSYLLVTDGHKLSIYHFDDPDPDSPCALPSKTLEIALSAAIGGASLITLTSIITGVVYYQLKKGGARKGYQTMVNYVD